MTSLPRPLLTVTLCAFLATSAVAQDDPATPEAESGADDGFSLIEEGAGLLLRGLMAEMEPAIDGMVKALEELQPAMKELLALIDDIRNYEAPRMLENGDILIPRRKDMPPPPNSLPPPGQGEIEL
jgi:hypothetical protein